MAREIIRLKSFEAGTILVRDIDDLSISFDAGDEFTRLIFITVGSEISSYRDWDSGEMEEVNSGNAIDVFTGGVLHWGTHMFTTVDTFIRWVGNIKFLIKHNPDLAEKIAEDAKQDFSITRFDKIKGIQAANATIRHAQTIIAGLESGEYQIPDTVKACYKRIATIRRSSKISALQNDIYDLRERMNEVDADSEEYKVMESELKELDDALEQLQTSSITDAEVMELINDELVVTLRKIASIELFDIPSLTEIEKRSREEYIRRELERAKESEDSNKNDDSPVYPESDDDGYNQSYDDCIEAVSDAIEEAECL